LLIHEKRLREERKEEGIETEGNGENNRSAKKKFFSSSSFRMKRSTVRSSCKGPKTSAATLNKNGEGKENGKGYLKPKKEAHKGRKNSLFILDKEREKGKENAIAMPFFRNLFSQKREG